MKNNTIVAASNRNYFWGVFLLLASMRKSGMDEPLLLFQNDFDDVLKERLNRLGGITFFQAPPSRRNMTCRKGEAMLAADTEYITWADCDGLFSGNCSELLPPRKEDEIHARMRLREDNGRTYQKFYGPEDQFGDIPKEFLRVWSRDVGERGNARNEACVSACFLSVHRSQRPFLERWQKQMDRVLPTEDTGVVNSDAKAYYQLDESVLNSLLCFMNEAPSVGDFRMDKDPGAMFCHLGGAPKPWVWWTPYCMRFYDSVMDVLAWAHTEGVLDYPVPAALNPRWTFLHKHIPFVDRAFQIKKKFRKIFGKH